MKKSNLYGLLGTFVSCITLLLFMWFYVMPYTIIVPPAEEEGLMVSFGYNEDGGGKGDELVAETPVGVSAPVKETVSPRVTEPAVAETKSSKPTSQNYVTQSEPSLAIAEQTKKNNERKRQDAIETERIATEKKIADQRRKEQDAINKANASMNGVFGTPGGTASTAGNGTGTGTGSGSGSGSQGNPAGHGYLGGNTLSINRSLTGNLVSPSYDLDVEGKITVNIRVNESGNVVSATIGSPTTISNASTRNAAISAAKKTHFSSGKGETSGSIVYNFKLR